MFKPGDVVQINFYDGQHRRHGENMDGTGHNVEVNHGDVGWILGQLEDGIVGDYSVRLLNGDVRSIWDRYLKPVGENTNA